MLKTLNILTSISLILLISISCSKSSSTGGGGGGGTAVDCNTIANKAFTADINPIIQGRCNVAGCHATGSTNGPGPLTTYDQVFAARSIIRTSVSSGSMPKNGTLTADQKNSIICWIDNGAPNN